MSFLPSALCLLPFLEETMSFDIRETRLRNDHQSIRNLVNRSEFIHLMLAEGNPPEKYWIRFTCKGVESINSSGKPKIREVHDVSVYLHAEYPLKQVANTHLSSQYSCDRCRLHWRMVAGQDAGRAAANAGGDGAVQEL